MDQNNIENDVPNQPVVTPVVEEYHESVPRRWPLGLLYGLMALVVAILVVFGGRALYRHNHPVVKTPSVTHVTSHITSTTVKNTTPAGSSTVGSSTSTTSAVNAAANLPNSGSGDVIGLFAGTAIAATGLHFAINLQRRSKA